MNFKRPRQKDAGHLDFIRSLPCVCCGNDIETEACHIRAGELFFGKRNTGGSEKPSDKWTLPMCGACHRDQHKGNELAFWKAHGIDPFVLALSLWACTGEYETALSVIEAQRHGGFVMRTDFFNSKAGTRHDRSDDRP